MKRIQVWIEVCKRTGRAARYLLFKKTNYLEKFWKVVEEAHREEDNTWNDDDVH